MKRWRVLLWITVLALVLGALPAAAQTPYYGDGNTDAAVNASDALLALQVAVDKQTVDWRQFVRLDVDENGILNAVDALLILRYAVGLIDAFPADHAGQQPAFDQQNFTLVYPAQSETLAAQAARIAGVMETLYGYAPACVADTEAPADGCEILLGDVDRPAAWRALHNTEPDAWRIATDEQSIILCGHTEEAVTQSVTAFLQGAVGRLTEAEPALAARGEYIPRSELLAPLPNGGAGRRNPRLIQTLYETEDVVIAEIVPTEDGYGVSPDGRGDSTAGIQRALDDCALLGGGTVFLPAGRYNLTGSLTIPPRVVLRGDWQDPDLGGDYGTVLQVYAPPADDELSGLLMLGGSGGAVGLTVYYPEQSLYEIKPYPFTFYTNGLGDNYMLSTVKNCTVINGYRGIGACCLNERLPAHEQLTVENFKGTFLKTAALVYNQADVGTWQGMTVDTRFWAHPGAGVVAPPEKALNAYTRLHTVGLTLGDLEWTEFIDLSVNNCATGVQIVHGRRIEFAGSLYQCTITNCNVGLLVDSLDTRWGMVIANSTIQGGIVNNTGGLVKMCNTRVSGGARGSVTADGTDLSSYRIDTARRYVKPAAKLTVVRLTATAGNAAAILQAALDAAGEAGGGVVYVPAGQYTFTSPITVPAGVELRGNAGAATRGFGGNATGTVFNVRYGDGERFDADTDPAFITLAGKAAGLNGVRILYGNNGPKNDDLNTTYAVRGTAPDVYVVNCCITAAGYGVDMRGCDRHFIKKVTACCYFNTFRLGGTDGVLSGCLQNGTVLVRTGERSRYDWIDESAIFTDLIDPILRQNARLIIVENATRQVIYNTFCYGCATLITSVNSADTLAVNVGSDNLGANKPQVHLDGGSMTVINAMRYNGISYTRQSGRLALFNRLTINNKNEDTWIVWE